jgi:hypothetical protein
MTNVRASMTRIETALRRFTVFINYWGFVGLVGLLFAWPPMETAALDNDRAINIQTVIQSKSLPGNSDLSDTMPVVGPKVVPRGKAGVWEHFLRLLVIVISVALGAIFALFIALLTGWIQIAC